MLIKSDVVNKGQNQKYVLNFNQRLSETLLLSKKLNKNHPTYKIYICVSVTEPSEPCGFTEHAVETKALHRHTACFGLYREFVDNIYLKK